MTNYQDLQPHEKARAWCRKIRQEMHEKHGWKSPEEVEGERNKQQQPINE